MRALLLSLIFSGFLIGTAHAQVNTAAPDQQSSILATNQELEADDFLLPNPSRWEFFKRRFVHFFTFNQTTRLSQELDLANLTLISARDAEDAGDSDRAAELLDTFNREMSRLSDELVTLATSLGTTSSDPALEELLAKIQGDRLLQASALERLSSTAQATVQTQAISARTAALQDLAQLLTADAPDPNDFQQRLAVVTTNLSEQESALEARVARKLATLEVIDDEVEDAELEDSIDEEEDELLAGLSDLDQATLRSVIDEINLSLAKHLLVLQSLLDKLPEASKPTVEAVLEQEVEKLKTALESDREALKRLFDEDHESELHDKLLERLSKETEASAEAVKDALEDQREATKKALERERERIKKQAENEKEDRTSESDDDDASENQDQDSDGDDDRDESGAPSSSSPSTGGQSTDSSASDSEDEDSEQVKTETKEIEIENGQFKTTRFEVEKGTRLTITLKNKDSVAHALAIVGSSASTGTVAAGSEKSLTVDVTQSLEYFCSLHSNMTRGTITAK